MSLSLFYLQLPSSLFWLWLKRYWYSKSPKKITVCTVVYVTTPTAGEPARCAQTSAGLEEWLYWIAQVLAGFAAAAGAYGTPGHCPLKAGASARHVPHRTCHQRRAHCADDAAWIPPARSQQTCRPYRTPGKLPTCDGLCGFGTPWGAENRLSCGMLSVGRVWRTELLKVCVYTNTTNNHINHIKKI